MLENVDFYYEDGLMVLTEAFLLKRGRCCKGNCRHCPYKGNNFKSAQVDEISHRLKGSNDEDI